MSLAPELARELAARIDGEVRVDAMTRELYATDASIYRAPPLAVAFPRHAEDVAAAMSFAAESGLPVLPRGGGTSLEGQAVNEALVLDCSRYLDAVVEVDPEARWARVQPGVIQDHLSAAVEDHGLRFGPDTATGSRATLGGMIGNNSAGAHSIVWGKTIDHVIELRCVLADGSEVGLGPPDDAGLQAKQRGSGVEGGLYRTVASVVEREGDEIRRRFPRIMRRVNGYNLDVLAKERPFNLAHLVVGSEGTLATVVEAKVRLVERPSRTALGVVQFDDLVEAMEAARRIVRTGPSAVELVDRLLLRQARSHPSLARDVAFLEGDPAALLLVEYSGDSATEVRDSVVSLRRLLQSKGLGHGFVAALEPEEQERVWRVRKAGLALMLSMKGDAKPIAFVEDTAVPVDRLPEYVRRLQEVVEGHETRAGFYGHASVGCLHFRPVVDLKREDDVGKLRAIAEEVRDLVMEFDGALAGEHGDGRTRTEFLPRFFGPRVYEAFRQVKTAFDPEGRLNPGNICEPLSPQARRPEGLQATRPPLRPPRYRIDTDLRYGPGYRTRYPDTALDWSREQGFDRAIEMCNGNGACRKLGTGTMCPSYMATREEEHTTRGRANALRAVISGALGDEDLGSRRLHEVLDLCLECKGCKAECPSGVDLAKLKYEFLAQYHAVHGTPLRSHLFGHISTLSRWGSLLAPLSNLVGGLPPVRWLNERLLGISGQRPLPRFVRTTFRERFESRPRREGRRGRVVLFDDTFMNHNVPEVGTDAVRLLEAAGYEPVLAPVGCCGRPMLSKGLVEAARGRARSNLDALAPFLEEGVPVVGCEPSCLLMLREDYRDLLPGDDRLDALEESTWLIEEFLLEGARRSGEARLGLALRPRPRRLLVHGHCHQKAASGVGPTAELLRWVPEQEPVALDTGCCGMAGSFGFEAEHYELSMQIGELALFPAIRAEPGAGVSTAGISCRQQVQHGTGREPRHPVQWLADALE